VLHGPCADGEPLRSGGSGSADTSLRHGRARGGHRHDRPPCARPAPYHVGADKAYDARGFTAELRRMVVTPHIARNDTTNKHGRRRPSSVHARTTRHRGYATSQRVRKRIEEAFAWTKCIAGCAKTKLRGLGRVRHQFTLAMAAYNLIRMPRLLASAT
jgi:hypothetical protein